MANLLRSFLGNKINLLMLFLSAILALNSLLFLSAQENIFQLFNNSVDCNLFYFIYLLISVIGIGSYLLQQNKFNFTDLLKKILILYLPTEIIFIYGLQETTGLTPYIGMASALYLLCLIIFIVATGLKSDKSIIEINTKKGGGKTFAIVLAIFAIMSVSLWFGNYNLGKIAVVDEPLWTFDRIPDFWKNVGEKDWYNARVSDKPGLTIAVISGAGLLSEENPKSFKNMPWVNNKILSENAIVKFNRAFRFPIWLFVVLMLPIIFVLLKKLVGQVSALLAISFIGLSPIIIGNARIINPDSILWIFVSLAIISYLLYLKNLRKSTLFLTALFLGLGILTKYTANILYLFFLMLIFAEYIFNHEKYSRETFYAYFKKHLLDYGLLVVLSFAIFYTFYPAVWEKPDRILLGTVYSQAFEPIWPFFAGMLSLIVADMLILKSFLMGALTDFFARFRRTIFLIITSTFILSILATIFNVYLDMRYFDFESIIASPKSSFSSSTVLGFFLANFYPMIFGISIIAIISIIIFLSLSLKKKPAFPQQNILTAFYLMLFILAYYLGSVASHVASIIRYQIVIFPIAFIIAGIACNELFKLLILQKNDSEQKTFIKQAIFFSGFIIILIASLWQTKPFYMGYASTLLPEKYYLDIKDMGEGSYEAAEYLNSLPNAEKLTIWTDKQGVCVFFVGNCRTNLSQKTFTANNIDYLVISSGRQSRTTKMGGEIELIGLTVGDAYFSDDFAKKIEIAGRSNNYVKIIKLQK